MKTQLKLFFLLTTSFLTIFNVHVAQADLYDITADFMRGNSNAPYTEFVGSFNYDSSSQTITNLTGYMNEGMQLTVANFEADLASGNTTAPYILTFTYQGPTTTVNPNPTGYINATTYQSSSQTTVSSTAGNAYMNISINASDPTLTSIPELVLYGTTGVAYTSPVYYMDCNSGGLMGSTCMGLGAMKEGFLSETVTLVPEPEEYGMLLLGFGLVGYQIKRKQRKSAQLMA